MLHRITETILRHGANITYVAGGGARGDATAEIQIEVEGKPTKTLHAGEVIWLEAGSLETLSIPGKKPSRYLQLSFKDSAAGATP